MVFGPLVSWIVGALESALVTGGLSAFSAALLSVGIPNNSIVKYEKAVKANKFLVIVHDTAENVDNARKILHAVNGQEIDVHDVKG